MSERLVKVNELIKQLVGELILREVDFGKEILVTISKVETSPDLRYSKILITVFPEGKEKDALAALSRDIFGLQRALNKKLNMRPIPKIRFDVDKIEQRAARIESLLAQIKEEEDEN